MFSKIFHRLFGSQNDRDLKKLQPIVQEVYQKKEKYEKFADDDFVKQTEEWKEKLAKISDPEKQNALLDKIKADAFALVREAAKRTLGLWAFDVQIIGATTLHQGKIAEMKTGEGKTLVATFSAYLNALTGKGVHIVTVNDYLAKRDATQMGELFSFLGLTTSFIVHGQNPTERKECYQADIVYATNNELGFDYLRDNMATSLNNLVQRDLHYAIIDEVDSILIDEARTPLIISAPASESTNRYQKYASLIPQLEGEKDYTIDEKSKSVLLTDEGIKKIEELLGMSNIYTEAGFIEVHHIEQALKAHALFKKDIDYVVKDGEIVIVDEFTGRLMPGRRYSDGLHQAIEAKEKVEIKRESKTLASITFQNFFRLYNKMAGMTGTAETEKEEFFQIYGSDTLVIPTNKPVVRDDKPDSIYKTITGKFSAITEIVKEKHKKGQPVLVGTTSIENSEALSSFFEKANIPHRVLNAKQHEKEAEIIMKAGQKGAVTIATNMAGRGTDIKLGEGVTELGGLCVIGSERHESRRIDNQLRGRSGRQGDPGESQFFVSMQDNLMRIFGGQRLQNVMSFLNVPENMPIENKMISRTIENAQKKIEGVHFDSRKHVLEYDSVLSKQRESVYRRRRKILEAQEVENDIREMIDKEAEGIVARNIDVKTGNYDEKNISLLTERLTKKTLALPEMKKEDPESEQKLIDHVKKNLTEMYDKQKEEALSEEIFFEIQKRVYLRSIDNLWVEHLDSMTNLRNDVSLYGYGQRNPLIEYKKESFYMYEHFLSQMQTSVLQTLFHISFEQSVSIVPKASKQIMTNEEEIENNITGKDASKRSSQKAKPQQETPKTDRNAPCPCGSGKKYKKCCGR